MPKIEKGKPFITESSIPPSMTAAVQKGYGGPEVIEIAEIKVPRPKENEVLVEVFAASINKGDWHILTGKPYMVRGVAGGFKKPGFLSPGQELAGRVVAVGSEVTGFQPGDEVFGDADHGALAEFALVPANRLAKKPGNTSFEEASSLPAGGITALQCLRDKLALKPGQHVLINGASGGVGTYAVQIAKALGARVTAVCSGKNQELVKALGADEVIDYTAENFTGRKEEFDCMLDLVGHSSLTQCRSVLKPAGKFVGTAGGKNNWVGPLWSFFKMAFSSLFSRKKMAPYFYQSNSSDLDELKKLVESEKIKATIQRTYKLSNVQEAFSLQGSGRANGKSVVTIK